MKKLFAWLLLGAMLLVPLGQAFGAISVTSIAHTVWGNKYVSIVKVTMDASYPTGGESLTATDLGLMSVDVVMPLADNRGVVFQYDYSEEKLMGFAMGDTFSTHLDELTNTTVLTDVEVYILAIGN